MVHADVDHPMGATGQQNAPGPHAQPQPPTELDVGVNNLVQEPVTFTNPFPNPSPPRKNICLAATPDVFDGTKSTYLRFLRQLKLFMMAYAREFDTDESKIIFTLSLMKKGTAELWAQTYMDQIINSSGCVGAWINFQEELNKTFIDYEENKRALQRFDALVQGKDPATDYFMKLEQLAAAACVKIHEDVQVISQVERGLNSVIVDKIYSSGDMPYSYESYKTQAIAIDELWRRRQEMKQAEGRTRPVVRDDWRDRGKPKPFEKARTRDPNAMEVDASKARLGRLCYLCGQPDHIAKDCTKRLQNRGAEVVEEKVKDVEEKGDF